MEWLSDNAWLGWLGLALALAAIEVATVDFVFVMLAGGALAGSLAASLGAPVPAQVIIAALVGALLVFLVRPIVRSRFLEGVADHGIGPSSLVGRSAQVIEAVTQFDGRVRLGGEIWSARVAEGGRTCEAGDEGRVVAIHGATAIVSGEKAIQDR